MSATPTDSESAVKKPTRVVGKGSKSTRVIVLKLSSDALGKFPSDSPLDASNTSQPPITVTSPADEVKPGDSPAQDKDKPDDGSKPADQASTPNPSEVNDDSSLAPPATNGVKRKGGPGTKSESAHDGTNGIKPRAKPGPKRRKLGDGEGGAKGLWTAPAPLNHKLGPKANQGDINARLRALDRSGKPCRKWERKGLQLATFHGVKWELGSWKKPPKPAEDASEAGDDNKSRTPGSSDGKQELPSSNVPSEKSQGGADSNVPRAANPVSSPAPGDSGTPVPTAS